MSGVTIQIRHLTRTVLNEKTLKDKRLLSDISTDFRPGEVTAIIGPSGCGKSTLLEAICGMTQADNTSSNRCAVYYNGQPYYQNIEEISRCVAYLPQFDSQWLHDDLPVSEELNFTQRLRTRKLDREGWLYSELHKEGITTERSNKIANLSGGQKKRVAIIGAKVASPKVLFLDEPTAPLDPGMSAQLVKELVKRARDENLTTIMVTHDPIALQGLGENSHVLLLKAESKDTGGEVAFDGSYKELGTFLKRHYGVNNTEEGIQQLFIDFSKSAKLNFIRENEREVPSVNEPEPIEVNALPNSLSQFLLLAKRELAILINQGSSLRTMLAIPLLLGFILGLVANKDELYTSYNMTKAMMFSLSACAFFSGVFDSISVFANKRRIEIEEFHGLKPSAYVWANAVIMTILCFVQALIIFLVFTKLAGLPESILYDAGGDMFLTAFFCAFSAAMLGMLCSSLFSNSTYLAPILVVIQIVFSGMIFTLEGATKTISYFVSCHWAMNALSALCDLNSLPVDVEVPNIGMTSIYYTNEDFNAETFTLFSSWSMLLVLGIGALLLTLLIMRTKRNKLFHPSSSKLGTPVKITKDLLNLLARYAPFLMAILVAGMLLYMAFIVKIDLLANLESLGSYLSLIASDIPSFINALFV